MLIASYLNNYELAKLDMCSSYMRYCIEGQYQVLYNTLAKEIGNTEAVGNNNKNFRRAYAQLVTRRPFQLSSSIKINPHAPEKLNLIASEFQFFNSP